MPPVCDRRVPKLQYSFTVFQFSSQFFYKHRELAVNRKNMKRGGMVSAVRTGGPDHNPIFQGIAAVDRKYAVANAHDRKSTERAAARKLLTSLGLLSDVYARNQTPHSN
jgi:hypothetical protein